MTNLLSTLLICCIGCSQGLSSATERDAALTPYVTRFIELGRDLTLNPEFSVGNLNYYFEDLGDNNIAGYYQNTGVKRVVVINTLYWKKYSEFEREQLLFHELGHSIGQGHRNETFPDNRPKSIMFWQMMREYVYLYRYDYYINELFTYTGTLETDSCILKYERTF